MSYMKTELMSYKQKYSSYSYKIKNYYSPIASMYIWLYLVKKF